MLELLVEKCLLCCEGGVGSLSPGNALRRVFECVASGILLSGKTNARLFFIVVDIGSIVQSTSCSISSEPHMIQVVPVV